VHLRIEGLRVTQVKHAGFPATSERVRYAPRQTDVGLPAQGGGGAIGRDLGKVAFQPDVMPVLDRYRRVRRFLPMLLHTMTFEGTQAGQPLAAAVRFLTQIEPQPYPNMRHAPLDFVPGARRRLVVPRHAPMADRHAYTLCAVDQLMHDMRTAASLHDQ
jgi:hypothetical protein